MLHQWALRDLAASGKWREAFPEGDLLNRAVNGLDGIARSAQESRR